MKESWRAQGAFCTNVLQLHVWTLCVCMYSPTSSARMMLVSLEGCVDRAWRTAFLEQPLPASSSTAWILATSGLVDDLERDHRDVIYHTRRAQRSGKALHALDLLFVHGFAGISPESWGWLGCVGMCHVKLSDYKRFLPVRVPSRYSCHVCVCMYMNKPTHWHERCWTSSRVNDVFVRLTQVCSELSGEPEGFIVTWPTYLFCLNLVHI